QGYCRVSGTCRARCRMKGCGGHSRMLCACRALLDLRGPFAPPPPWHGPCSERHRPGARSAGVKGWPILKDYTWVETNSPVASSRTDDIHFFDPESGWLVNSNGQAALTTDGGCTWAVKLVVPMGLKARPYLRTVGFANRQKGWIGALVHAEDDPEGYHLQLLRMTEDGGETWTNVELPRGSPSGICGLSVVNENVVYGAGSNDPNRIGPGVVKTTNGGQSWELIDM